MQCPDCGSNHIRKNVKIKGKQHHNCVDYRCQFINGYTDPQGNSDQSSLFETVGYGMGFRDIERITGVHHTTVVNWVRLVGERLPDAYAPEALPEVGEIVSKTYMT